MNIHSPDNWFSKTGASHDKNLWLKWYNLLIFEDNMAKISPITFLRQVRTEARKIVWPTRQETTVSTLAVFIMVFIAAVFLFAADQTMAFVVNLILKLGI
jgi:preprotein translocase subunit SecE